MDEFKSNSFKSREKNESGNTPVKPKLEKIVSKPVVKKEKGIMTKMREAFFPEEITDVKSYLIFDVAIPAIKDLVSDLVCKGTDAILFNGDTRRSRRSSNGATYVNYSSITSGNNSRRLSDTRRSASSSSVGEIILSDKGEAEAVLDSLMDILEQYESVPVADLHELVGLPVEHTDYKYGWTNLSSASVARVRDGYLLRLPRPVAL